MSDIKLTPDELEAMLDRAARRGAKEALRSIGLLDDDAHKDIAVKFQGGEGHCILRLTKQGWANKVETAQFSIYDDVNTVGS